MPDAVRSGAGLRSEWRTVVEREAAMKYGKNERSNGVVKMEVAGLAV